MPDGTDAYLLCTSFHTCKTGIMLVLRGREKQNQKKKKTLKSSEPSPVSF